MINNSIIANRTKDWWQPKAGNLLAILYLAAGHFTLNFLQFSYALIPSLITILGIGLSTYIINDWIDLPTDRIANKKNMLINLSVGKRFLFLILAVATAFVPWIFLPITSITLLLIGIEVLLVIFYSVPPIRLKTRGFLGVITDALYAYAIPAVLAYYTFSVFNEQKTTIYEFNFIALFVWQLFTGIFNMSLHQLEDYDNDRMTKTKTWSIKIGKLKTRKIMMLVFWPLMIIWFFMFLGSNNYFTWGIFTTSFLLITVRLIPVFLAKSPQRFLNNTFAQDFQRINIHYHSFLPLLVLGFLSISQPAYLILFFLHALFFSFHFFQTIWHIGKKLMYVYFIDPIYYHFFRKDGGILRAKKNVQRKEEQISSMNFNVAVINRNKDKYTETFIKQRVNALIEEGYNVHYLFGDDLPTESDKKGTILSNYSTIRYSKKWAYAFMDKTEKNLNENALRNYFLNQNIQLVLAEFGTVGKEIAPICLSLKLPYIITFYGYDFHHESTFRANKESYIYALNGAEGIIGVSTEITEKIKENTINNLKVKYLPCLVNTELFLALDRNPIPYQFLSIGRFAETKAPNLTILAFSEVLKSFPDARLVMIGKDGGGELFESCIILAKSLNIEESIDFRGICTADEVARIMQQSAVFVQHSLTTPINKDKEGTPVSVMEAMCAGLPIVSTKHAGILDLITHNQNGLLVDEYDWKAMANEMKRIIADNEFANRIGLNARNSILQNDLIINGKNQFIQYVNSMKNKISENEK